MGRSIAPRLLFGLNQPGAWDQGDFNYDGQVNSADLQELLFTLNTSLGNQVAAAALNAGAGVALATSSGSQPRWLYNAGGHRDDSMRIASNHTTKRRSQGRWFGIRVK